MILLLLACQEPFAEDRHDLASFRIAALSARPNAEGGLDLAALVYPGWGLWHDTTPAIHWSAGGWEAEGPRVVYPGVLPATIEVTATQDDLSERASWAIGSPPSPPLIAAWSRGATSLTLADIVAPIEARAAVPPGEDTPVAAGGSLRIALDVVDDGSRTTHWMGTAGQFAEIDGHTTDWFAGTAVIDDAEVESSSPVEAGVYPLVALTLDGLGGNTWAYFDARVDTPGPFLHVAGRTFPVATTSGPEGWWEAMVEAEDSLVGLRLVDVAAVAEPATEPVCGAVAFDPAGVAEGWCPRAEVVGRRVTLWGEVRP